MYAKIGVTVVAGLLLAGCSGNNTEVTRNTDAAFPHAFELASLSSEAPMAASLGGAYGAEVGSHIDRLLDGSLPLKDVFTPELVYQHAHDAVCYGPVMQYKNHPDDLTAPANELPSGDLGIWDINESNTTEACTVAQLNARMSGIKKRSMSSLFMLASSLDAMYDAGHTLPAVGVSALNITSSMPTVPDVTFSTVTIEQTASGVYNYVIGFDYVRSGTSYGVQFDVTHRAGASKEDYIGKIKYQIEDTMTGGNCGVGENNITKKGSIVYARTSSDDFEVDAREADFCGHSTSSGFDSDGLLDPSDRYDMSTNPDGWGNNYTRFVANYKKSNQSGQYSYVWQAGPNDSHSRILQIDLNDHATVDGESYFGYGAQVFDLTATSGEIQGMICNWAGPNNSHTPQPYAQRQSLTYSTAKSVFETPTGGSDITYAPTNSCLYDGSGTFDYDRGQNGVLAGTDTVVVKVGAGAGELEFDLMSDDGLTVPGKITSRGAHLPIAPTWP